MKSAILLCLVSISVVVLAKPNPFSTDSDFLKQLDEAITEVHAHQNETVTAQVEVSDGVNLTSEEVDYDHSYEHDDHDGDDFSHEDCDHSDESVESDEHHSTKSPQDVHLAINDH